MKAPDKDYKEFLTWYKPIEKQLIGFGIKKTAFIAWLKSKEITTTDILNGLKKGMYGF